MPNLFHVVSKARRDREDGYEAAFAPFSLVAPSIPLSEVVCGQSSLKVIRENPVLIEDERNKEEGFIGEFYQYQLPVIVVHNPMEPPRCFNTPCTAPVMGYIRSRDSSLSQLFELLPLSLDLCSVARLYIESKTSGAKKAGFGPPPRGSPTQ